MPRRQLQYPQQIHEWLNEWLNEWGEKLESPAEMILIGSGGILWHAFAKGIKDPLTEKSMDVDPITFDEAVAELSYESIIGSEFELEKGWHVNLMPELVLREFPEGWRERASTTVNGNLTTVIPAVEDLLFPKMKRNEPRDRAHFEWAKSHRLIEVE